MSDVDIAILPSPEVPDEKRLLLRGKVATRAAGIFETEHADVILLDEAPLRLAYQAVQGTLFLDREPEARIQHERRIEASVSRR